MIGVLSRRGSWAAARLSSPLVRALGGVDFGEGVRNKSIEGKPPPVPEEGSQRLKDAADAAKSSAEPEENLVDMFALGPTQGRVEWNGPTRGGTKPEPTRYGDWERGGRAIDF